jgi:hypothetical protein
VVGFTVVSGREVPWKRKPVTREHNNIDNNRGNKTCD